MSLPDNAYGTQGLNGNKVSFKHVFIKFISILVCYLDASRISIGVTDFSLQRKSRLRYCSQVV